MRRGPGNRPPIPHEDRDPQALQAFGRRVDGDRLRAGRPRRVAEVRRSRDRGGLGSPFRGWGAAEWPPIPRIWPESVVVLVAGGPSLDAAQCAVAARARAAGKAFVLGVNDAYRIAELDALYACDGPWWTAHDGVAGFGGIKVTQDAEVPRRWAGIRRAPLTGFNGLELLPVGIRGGGNGGYQAMNLALHFGARRIVLLGLDMRSPAPGRSHWFGDHPGALQKASPYGQWIDSFRAVAPLYAAAGVDVVNATPGSALDAFRRTTIEEALSCP